MRLVVALVAVVLVLGLARADDAKKYAGQIVISPDAVPTNRDQLAAFLAANAAVDGHYELIKGPPWDVNLVGFPAKDVDKVTLVFTDMVDSTALKHQLGDHAGAAFFEEHHTLVRQTLACFPQGEEIQTAGDSFLILFSTPSYAVQFALLLQS